MCLSNFTINSKASQVSAIACVTSTLCEPQCFSVVKVDNSGVSV